MKDREDVQILCDSGLLTAARLVEAFESAHAFSEPGEPREEFAASNLQRVLEYLGGKTAAL